MAFVSQVPGGQAALTVQDAAATEARRLVVVAPDAAFLWAPSGDRLAFSSRVAGQQLFYGGLETVKGDGSDRQRVSDQSVAAFYWSPDGKRLAFAALDPAVRALTWNVVDADGKNRRQVGSFVPSRDQLFVFTYFDQYAQSHAVWSPDGKYLTYAGTTVEKARGDVRDPNAAQAQQDELPPQVFVVPADGSAQPRAVVDGSLGVWPIGQRRP
jgi:TolB protein